MLSGHSPNPDESDQDVRHHPEVIDLSFVSTFGKTERAILGSRKDDCSPDLVAVIPNLGGTSSNRPRDPVSVSLGNDK